MALMDDIFASGDQGKQFVAGLMARFANNPPDPDGAMAQADVPSGDLLAHIAGGLAQKGANAVQSAVTAPRDAYTGDLQVFDPTTGHVSDEAMRRANEMAGLAMTGSLPFEAPQGALRMFGGKNAATADHYALNAAQSLERAGADRDHIWDATGWFKAPDGHWKFEIPDDAATIGPAVHAPPEYSRLHHDDLAEAYPGLWQNTGQSIKQGPTESGKFDALADVIHAQGPTDQAQRSVALHEMQHAIQREEGFARGGNPEEFRTGEPAHWAKVYGASSQAANRVAMLGERPTDAAAFIAKTQGLDPVQIQYMLEKHPADELARLASDHSPRGMYRRQAGEVEARNVQARMNMTPDQRFNTPPWLTQDVPDAQQIVRLLSGSR